MISFVEVSPIHKNDATFTVIQKCLNKLRYYAYEQPKALYITDNFPKLYATAKFG